MLSHRLFRPIAAGFIASITSIAMAHDTQVPPWDARGMGPPPAQGISALHVDEDGSRIVVGTMALPGDPNTHVLDGEGRLLKSYRVGQRWIEGVAIADDDEAFALCTMTTGRSGDEPLVYRCGAEVAAIGGDPGGMLLFHYGDHSNHTGRRLAAIRDGGVIAGDGQLLWLSRTAAAGSRPAHKASFRNLKPTALATHHSGVAVVGGYADHRVDGRTSDAAAANLLVYKPSSLQPAWSREAVHDVGDSVPPEPGDYGRPMLADGSRNPLPQRDEQTHAPLSIAVSREAEFDDATTRIAAADYRGWRRWIRSSSSGVEELYGVRFQPARPTVTVYDGAGRTLRRFDAAAFPRPAWVDLAFLPDSRQLLAFPHSWTSRGLAGQPRLPVDDQAAAVWLLDIPSGEVRERRFPDAVAGVAIHDDGSVAVSCWNGRVYSFEAGSLTTGPLPEGVAVGGPALVHLTGNGRQLIAATAAGEVVFVAPGGNVLRRVNLNAAVPRGEKPWVAKAQATRLAEGLWQLPGGRVESDLGGQRIIEAPDGLILIEGHAGLSFESEWHAIEAAGLDPRRVKYVLATHEHGDHAPGAALWRVATGARFVCSRQMAYTLQHHLPVGTGYGFHPPVATDIVIDDDTVLDLASLKVGAVRLPGHTFGSMGWLFERADKRFVAIGDLIMPEGVLGYAGSINFSPYQVLESLRKLDGLRVDTILPGHGPVVGPDKYVAAGIAVGTRVGWGKMPPEHPDPRFAISDPHVLVTAFLADAAGADFGDVDGDGLPDVAVVAPDGGGSIVKVFLNRPSRQPRFDPMKADFTVAVPTVAIPSRLRLRTLGDTGRPAIFVSGQSTAALLLPQPPPGEYAVHPFPAQETHQLRAVDLDGSGKPRPLVLGRFSGARLVDLDATPTATSRPLDKQLDSPYADVREMDVNGDGRPDLLTNQGRIWLRDPAGRVDVSEPPTQHLPVPTQNDWIFCNVGDVNGDRRPDLILIGYGMRERIITVFHNTGDPVRPFPEQPDTRLEIASSHPHVRDASPVGDWNGDGIDDLVVGLGQDNQVRVFSGSRTGLSPDRGESIPLEYWLHYEHPPSLADFDGDGLLDLACFGSTKTGVGTGGPPAAYILLRNAPTARE